jgi:ribonuclease D
MLIQDGDKLKAVCQEIEKEPFLILDTEFLRNKDYYPKLCLIQIATSSHLFAVDTLANIELAPLVKLLSNPHTTKVVHSARQDVEVLFHTFGFMVPKIFDTQLAMQFLSVGEPISYEGLVKHFLGNKVDKQLQYSDWIQRPLTTNQLAYALLDVEYLRDIYPIMLKELEKRGRLNWALEECSSYDEIKDFYPNEEELVRKFLAFFKETAELQKCLQVLRFREQAARKNNVIRSLILNDEEVALLVRQGTVGDKIKRKLGSLSDELSEILLSREVNPKDQELVDKIISYRQTQGYPKTFAFEVLKVLLKKISYDQEIAPTLIATTNDLVKLASGLKEKKFSKGWRKEIFGDTIEAFLQSKEGLYCKDGLLELR